MIDSTINADGAGLSFPQSLCQVNQLLSLGSYLTSRYEKSLDCLVSLQASYKQQSRFFKYSS